MTGNFERSERKMICDLSRKNKLTLRPEILKNEEKKLFAARPKKKNYVFLHFMRYRPFNS